MPTSFFQSRGVPPSRNTRGGGSTSQRIGNSAEQLDRAIAKQVPFAVVGADPLYGRDGAFRDHIAASGTWYLVSIPCDRAVWKDEPQIGRPAKRPGQRGPAYKHEQVVSLAAPIQGRALRDELLFAPLDVRDCERGRLSYEHAFTEGWTVREETRQDPQGHSDRGDGRSRNDW